MAISEEIKRMVRNALDEDLGPGDVTSDAIIPPAAHVTGEFLVKAPGVVAGLAVVDEVLEQMAARNGQAIGYSALVADGTVVTPGDVVATVAGDGPSLLSAERVALNFLQRMSGIASATRRYVNAVAGTRAKILDTRKTAPGLRALDKWAVTLGGGCNHRFGLYDMVLIKDNHIQAAGGISQAVERLRGRAQGLAIEVEVTSLVQLEEALALGVRRILLDNMTPEVMREAVQRTAGRAELEASGGITLENVAEVACTGVDLISIGALTHSVRALDISLEIGAI